MRRAVARAHAPALSCARAAAVTAVAIAVGFAGLRPASATANAPASPASPASSAPSALERPAQKLRHPERAPMLAAAQAGERLVAAGDFGTIVLSEDHGKTWRQARSVPTRVTLTALHFLDARRGWAVGHAGTILVTEDGGESWRVQHRAGDEAVFFSVRFFDERHGLAVGSFGLALRTTDGGANWTPLKIGEGDMHLYQIFTDARGATWIAAEMGTLYRSDDSVDFTQVEVPYDGSLWGGMGLADGSLLVWGMGGTLLRSQDDGRTWKEIDTDTENPITAACALPDGRVVFVGLGGTVLTSGDAGATVDTVIRPQRSAYTAVLVHDGKPLLFSLAGIERPQP